MTDFEIQPMGHLESGLWVMLLSTIRMPASKFKLRVIGSQTSCSGRRWRRRRRRGARGSGGRGARSTNVRGQARAQGRRVHSPAARCTPPTTTFYPRYWSLYNSPAPEIEHCRDAIKSYLDAYCVRRWRFNKQNRGNVLTLHSNKTSHRLFGFFPSFLSSTQFLRRKARQDRVA